MGSSSSDNDINYPQVFYQPLYSHFLNSFKLPVSFMKKVEGELKGHGLESVVLMTQKQTHNQHWVVRIEQGRHFNADDWNKFVVHHQLKVGDFLVFRHLGHFLFNVIVFDAVTACDSSFLPLKHRENTRPNEKEQVQEVPSRSWKRKKGRSLLPSCNFRLSPYAARSSILNLPMKFVREHKLSCRRRCEATLIDPKKKPWQVWLNYNKSSGQGYMSSGWKAFRDTNVIKSGDLIKLETLHAGQHPVFECSITARESSLPSSKPRYTTRVKQEDEENEEEEHEAAEKEAPSRTKRRGQPPFPSCNLTLTPYQASYGVVDGSLKPMGYSSPNENNLLLELTTTRILQSPNSLTLPSKFIKDSGLFRRRCGVTLIDTKNRSWEVGLNFKDDRVSYFNKGWKDFQEANLLKCGDAIKIQILDAGKQPVFKCPRLSIGRKSA